MPFATSENIHIHESSLFLQLELRWTLKSALGTLSKISVALNNTPTSGQLKLVSDNLSYLDSNPRLKTNQPLSFVFHLQREVPASTTGDDYSLPVAASAQNSNVSTSSSASGTTTGAAGSGAMSAAAASFVQCCDYACCIEVRYSVDGSERTHLFSYPLVVTLPDSWLLCQLTPARAAPRKLHIGQPCSFDLALTAVSCLPASRRAPGAGDVMVYDVVADPADWIVSGAVRAQFRLPAAGQPHTTTVSLLPVRAGLLNLPAVRVAVTDTRASFESLVHVESLSRRQQVQVFPFVLTSGSGSISIS